MASIERKEFPALVVPESVERRQAWIWADGNRLDADVYRPIGLKEDDGVPGVVLSHGWGGDKRSAERYAALFAEAGMIAVCFTHSSWESSAPKMTLLSETVEPEADGTATVQVRLARQLVDPIDWANSFRAATDFLVGEPNVDVERIGAWGTSYGGGSAAYCAATDRRIKALSVQVAMLFDLPEQLREIAQQRATQIARGEHEAVPQTDRFGDAVGVPHYARMAQFDIENKVALISVPTLILDAENDELIDIEHSGGAAFRVLETNGVSVRYEVFEKIDHYGIYFDGYERSSQMALKWFEEHLLSSEAS